MIRTSNLWAEAIGSPASILKKRQWTFGLGGGALLERGIKASGSADLKASIYQAGHFRGYGLTDWLSLYGKVGGAGMVLDGALPKEVSSDFGMGYLLGAQVKMKLWEHVKTGLEWDGSIQFVRIRARHRNDNDGTWKEWQFATSLAKPFGRVKPYVGVVASLVDFQFKLRRAGAIVQQSDYEADGTIGAFLGTDCYFGETEDVILNVETSYINGAEVTAALKYTF